MSIRATANTFNDAFIRDFQSKNNEMVKQQINLSTGQSVRSPSDDPAVMRRVMISESEKREMVQHRHNHNYATQIDRVSHGALNNLHDVLSRASLVASTTDGLKDDAGYAQRADEIDNLIEQALPILNRNYNGEYLFGGDQFDTVSFTATRDGSNKVTSVSYTGSATASEFYVATGVKMPSRLSPTDTQKFSDLMNRMISLRDNITSVNQSGIATDIVNLNTSENDLLASKSSQGSNTARLEMLKAHDDAIYRSREEQISRSVDSDLAASMQKVLQLQTAIEASMQSGVMLMKSNNILNYLR